MTCYETAEKFRRDQYKTIKTEDERALSMAEFPSCKGLYPDCPENPDKNEKPCKFCPVLD